MADVDKHKVGDKFEEYFADHRQAAIEDLREQPARDRTSLRIDWQHLHEWDDTLARRFRRQPGPIREAASNALARQRFGFDTDRTRIRVYNLPEEHIYRVGRYRTRHLGRLIGVRGRVVDHEGVQPYVEHAAFECARCGTLTRLPQSHGRLVKPHECQGCERTASGQDSTYFALDREQSTLVDYQEVVLIPSDTNLEEPPTELVYLKGDIVNTVAKDEIATVVGVYETFASQSDTVLNTFVKAMDINHEDHAEADLLASEDLGDEILRIIEEREDDGDNLGVWPADIADTLSERGVREEEVNDRIEDLIDDGELFDNSGRVAIL